jgi:hypothetical protein
MIDIMVTIYKCATLYAINCNVVETMFVAMTWPEHLKGLPSVNQMVMSKHQLFKQTMLCNMFNNMILCREKDLLASSAVHFGFKSKL